MIEILVSDLGKVLLPFDTEPCWRRILPRCSRAEAEVRARFDALLAESGLGVGGVTAQEFHACLGRELGLAMPYPEFCEAWSDMFWEDPEVIELIRGLNKETEEKIQTILTAEQKKSWRRMTGDEFKLEFKGPGGGFGGKNFKKKQVQE